MKTLLATILFSTVTAASALAQTAPTDCTQPCQSTQPAVPPPTVAAATVSPTPAPPTSGPSLTDGTDEDTGWHRPAGERFTSGFRLGWMYIANFDQPSRVDDKGMQKSIKDEFGLKNPNMFVIGYEGFYRIVGHSWLNVLMVGNVSVAGLDQSKFIPTASGLLGFEVQRSFELGVGVNLAPDPEAPSHMILAAGWTPKIGSIQTPLHFFWIPEPVSHDAMGNRLGGNSRVGATIGMNW